MEQAGHRPQKTTSASSIDEAVVVGRGQAGRASDGAVDVARWLRTSGTRRGGGCPDPGLVAGHRPERLDAPYQAGGGERTQDVVHGLVGDLTEIRAYGADDRVGVRVRVVAHRGQHRQPWAGDAQLSLAQGLLELPVPWSRPQFTPFS